MTISLRISLLRVCFRRILLAILCFARNNPSSRRSQLKMRETTRFFLFFFASICFVYHFTTSNWYSQCIQHQCLCAE
uniref:Uncharacterized protein n=1 Tax=Rhipicephalus microplus TaxID=6941 RepID=A0A6G5A2B7_RHIMP